MKTIIFVVAGLLLGTLGGTAFGGLKGKDAVLAELQTRKAAAESARHEEQGEVQHQTQHEGEAAAGGTPGTGIEAGILDPNESSPPAGAQPIVEEEEGGALARQADPPVETGPDAVQATTSPGAEEAGVVEDAGVAGEPSADAEGATARLARIFGAMKARDAANVLQNLNDAEVKSILFHLTDRKAAEILGNFEPARAATLSRAVLGSPGGEGS